MLKNQKQRCKEPVIACLMSADQKTSTSRPRKRQIIQQLSRRKQKVIQTRSDNNHNRKTIAQKKLKSLNLIPKQEMILEQPFDQYQMGNRGHVVRKQNRQIQPKDKYNQCLRDDSSSSNYGEIVGHYRQSKSRYKNNKQKAKRLIQKMIGNSKNGSQQVTSQLKQKIQQIKTQLPVDKYSSEEYCMTERPLQKSSSVTGSIHFKPKVEKCSTLRLATQQSRSGSRLRPLSSKRQPSGMVPNSLSQSKMYPRQQIPPKPSTPSQSSQKSLSTQRQLTILTTSQAKSSQNPLVLQGKHLFSEYGIADFPGTQKQIIEQTQNASRQVSKQLPVSRKQTQKIITRARQKNKKIIGKLKEMREKRSEFRNSMEVKNDLTKSMSRFSKLAGNNNVRSNVRQSALQSRIEQMRSNLVMQSSASNFLSLSSNVHSSSVVAFNEETREKILIHLETLKTIADYAQSFSQIYQDCTEWQDLIFLLYKKYYIERFKIYGLLKDGCYRFKTGEVSKESPFVLEFCMVSEQEVEIFRESKEELAVELQLQVTNVQVKNALRDLYNKFIQKAAQNTSINMWQVDDFAQQILQDLNQQINLLIESCGKSQKIKKRINQAIQVGLMIAHIQGYTLQEIEEIVVGDLQNREYFDRFYPKFLEIFQAEGQE